MKLFTPTLIIALAGVVLTPISAPWAAPITTLFNTGVDASGTPLANDATEIHYSLVSVPAGGINDVRVANSNNGYPIPPWIGDNASSAWIGPNTSDLSDPEGAYDYQLTFSLSGYVAATASISGKWSADNQGTDIRINGASTGSTAADFASFYTFAITGGFVDGLNTLDFLVVNTPGYADNPTGLRVEMTGSADPVSTPEPTSLAILGVGLFGLRMFRRKQA